MGNKKLTLFRFLGRFFAMVVAAAMAGSTSILIFYRFTLQATTADQKLITSRGFPITIVGILLYLAVLSLLARPLVAYIRSTNRDEDVDQETVNRVQDCALNLAPRMCLAAGAFYFTITPLILYRSIDLLGWPINTLIYGFMAGTFALFMLVPVALNMANWSVRPIVDHTITRPGVAPSRRGGDHVDVRTKLVMSSLPVVFASLLFTAAVGYSQNQSLLENYTRLQSEFVSQDEAQTLADSIEHRADTRIKSSRYFSNKLGNLKIFYFTIVIVALSVALIFMSISSSEISRPLKILMDAVRQIKAGKSDESVNIVSNDEFAELGESMNGMMGAIAGQIQSMGSVVESLRGGIYEFNSTVATVVALSGGQSSGATQQSAAVQEASSIAEEILATARQISDRAVVMDDFASRALDACKEGEQTLDHARGAFDAISQHSEILIFGMQELDAAFKKTLKVVRWIEDIAEQTELLALNASLEAAGAGVHGRRFGVVAESTRRLAQRAMANAHEIKTMMESILGATSTSIEIAGKGKERITAGGEAIEMVNKYLQTISSLTGATSSHVHEIKTSTGQQTLATEQLATSFAEISDVAKVVEDSSKEIENSISELRKFTLRMKEIVQSRPQNA